MRRKKNVPICALIIILMFFLNSCQKYFRYSNLPIYAEGYGASQYRDLSEFQKRRYLKIEKGYTDNIIETIIGGSVKLDMTREQVIFSWGRPNDINKTVGSWGVHEQWVYNRGSIQRQYLYFENDKLTSWQD
jgi:hypothetical protein